MTVIIMKADPARAAQWKAIFNEEAPDIDFRIWPDAGDGGDIDCLLTWDIPDGLRESFPNLKVVHAIGAGVDHIDLTSIPDNVPLVRMVEPGIQAAMNEWAVMAILMSHRRMVDYGIQQRSSVWAEIQVPPASARCVGVMGTGALGASVLAALRPFGFRTRTWGRSRKPLDVGEQFAGRHELEPFLAGCDILVCLLPLTAETRGILDRDVFSGLPRGATVINVSRGGNLNQGDLLAALDTGQVGAAILDVCDPQPLPPGHPFWSHPRILLTPHIATRTQASTGARAVIANLRRLENGEPLENVVDRHRGY